MASQKELRELQKQLDLLEKKYKSIKKVSPFDGKDAAQVAKQFGSIKEAVESVEVSMKGIRQEILEAESGLEGLKDTFNDIARELGNIDDPLKNMNKGFRKIRGFAEELSDIQYDLTASSVKQTKDLKTKVNLEFNRLKRQSQYLQELLKENKLSEKQKKDAEELLALAKDKERSLVEQVGHQDNFNKALDQTLKQQKNINKATGLSGKIIGGLGGFAEKLGFKGVADDLEGINDKMKEKAVLLTDNGKKAASLGDMFKVMGTGVAGLFSSLKDALTDPLSIITMIIKAVQFLLGIFNHVLKVTNQVGQAFGVAGANAKKLKAEIHAAGDRSGDMYYFTEELLDAQVSLNKAVGMNLKFNEKNAKTFQDLTLYMGLSAESAGKLFKLSSEMGVPFEGMYDNVVGTVNSLNEGSGFSITTADAIERIGNSSASVRFNIKGGTEGLVKAAHTAARLGTTMDEIAAAASSHLDFENSIAKEIEAEMFLQRDLNLEKLRHAALTGDTATAAAEQERLIRENMGSLKGNVLAQQAFADALGISSEQLAEQMNSIEKNKNLSAEQLKMKQAEQEEQAKLGKDAASFDRAMQSAVKQLKAALEPIAMKIGPMVLSIIKKVGPMLEKVISFVANNAKIIALIGGLAVGGAIVSKIAGGIKGLFGGFFEKGSMANPMITYNLNEQGGGGGDLFRAGGSRLFKYFGKKGGFTRTLQRGILKTFGKTKFTKALYNFTGKSGNFVRTLGGLSKSGKFSIGGGFEKMGKFNPFKLITGKAAATKFGTAGTLGAPGTRIPGAASKPGMVSNLASKVPGGTKILSGLAKTAKVLGPIGVALDAGLGGFTGYSQAQMSAEEQKAAGVKQNIGTGEATALGVLTGGAEKGSMLSSYVGIEKGSGADEAMGVLGSAGRGAAIGATIGSIIPGVGTAIGAGVGALVGGVSESFKLLTNPDSKLRQGLSKAADYVGEKLTGAFDSVKEFGSNALDSIKGFASSAGEKLSEWGGKAKDAFNSFTSWAGEGISSMANKAKEKLGGAVDYVKNSRVGKAVQSAGSYVADKAKSVYKSVKESKYNPLNWFADGGIVTKPMVAGVGEAGPEAIIPLDQAQSMLGGGGNGEVAALLKELISEVRKGGNVYLDGSKVGHVLALQSSQMG